MRKKVIIACKRRRVSEEIRAQLEQMLGDDAEVSLLLVNEEPSCRIYCDLVIAISEEVARQVSPYLMGNTEIIMLQLTIQRSMYDRLKETRGEERAIVVNNTLELAQETIRLLYALGMKNIELFPFYPGCRTDYSGIRLAITPNEFSNIPEYIEQIVDIGERCLDPLTLIEVFSRLDCLNSETIEMIFSYGQSVISVNQGITELTRNGHDFGSSQRQFLENFHDAVFLLDREGRINASNSVAQDIFGVSYMYLIHRNVRELIPELKRFSNIREGIRNEQVTLGGRKYLVTWNLASGSQRGSVLVLKSVDEIRSLYVRYGSERAKKGDVRYSFKDIIGSSQEMQDVKDKARRFASTEFPILIQGESGTGKELLAQAIHQSSERRKGPFVAFNCAALTDSLLESELFGYQEGAFTGASKKGRAGYFEMASGGTLFMDEIGDVSLGMQAKILRVLQEQEVVRVGGSEPIPVNVRIISATNRNLWELVGEKKFRLDLYYRLNTLILQTVPLRDRTGDIMDLLPFFFKKNHIKKNISQEALDFMLQYPWMGNVRELENCVSYFSIVEKDTIHMEDFPEHMKNEKNEKNRKKEELFIKKEDNEGGTETHILKELLVCYQKKEKIGRKRLAEKISLQGIMVSEAEIRSVLEQMEEDGLIEISKGRGGTRITEKGRSVLES